MVGAHDRCILVLVAWVYSIYEYRRHLFVRASGRQGRYDVSVHSVRWARWHGLHRYYRGDVVICPVVADPPVYSSCSVVWYRVHLHEVRLPGALLLLLGVLGILVSELL